MDRKMTTVSTLSSKTLSLVANTPGTVVETPNTLPTAGEEP